MNWRCDDLEVELEWCGETVTAYIDAEIDYDEEDGTRPEENLYYSKVTLIAGEPPKEREIDLLAVLGAHHDGESNAPIFKVLNQKVMEYLDSQLDE